MRSADSGAKIPPPPLHHDLVSEAVSRLIEVAETKNVILNSIALAHELGTQQLPPKEKEKGDFLPPTSPFRVVTLFRWAPPIETGAVVECARGGRAGKFSLFFPVIGSRFLLRSSSQSLAPRKSTMGSKDAESLRTHKSCLTTKGGRKEAGERGADPKKGTPSAFPISSPAMLS